MTRKKLPTPLMSNLHILQKIYICVNRQESVILKMKIAGKR